jgi:hypothetical protein
MKSSKVSLIRKVAALDLWEFGEDIYVKKALQFSDDELAHLGELTYNNFNKDFYEKGGKSLPNSGYDIGFVTALTLVEYFEGNVRPLKRGRRRTHTDLPKNLEISEEDYLGADSTRNKLWSRLKKYVQREK